MRVQVRAVSCWYTRATAREAAPLSQVSFSCTNGECVGVVGTSGAGKSTLLLVLAGLLPIQEGAVYYAGAPTTVTARRRWLRQNVAIAFQQPEQQLFARTALADVMYGPLNLGCSTNAAREAAIQALQLLGLDAKAASERSPFAYSGGERRLIALASIFAMRPKLLLLDEPTAGLDRSARQRVMQAVAEFTSNGGICLLATHELKLAQKICQRLLVLNKGHLIADCNPDFLLANAPDPLAQLAALLNTQGWQLPNKLWEPSSLATQIAERWFDQGGH